MSAVGGAVPLDALAGAPASGWVVTVGATPEPVVPELRGDLDPEDVSPGLLGFLVIFAAVLACIPLFRSMAGKLRRIERSAQLERDEEELEEHEARLRDRAAGRPDDDSLRGAPGADPDDDTRPGA